MPPLPSMGYFLLLFQGAARVPPRADALCGDRKESRAVRLGRRFTWKSWGRHSVGAFTCIMTEMPSPCGQEGKLRLGELRKLLGSHGW